MCSQGKDTEVVCHSLLQWPTFSQTSLPVLLGHPHVAWISFIGLDKVVVHVIRLASCLWLWFQSVCPLMPSLSAYYITWVSLTLNVGYPFTAAPAKRSQCSLPWKWGSSSLLLLRHCRHHPFQIGTFPKPFCSEFFASLSISPSEKEVPGSLLRAKAKSTMGEKNGEHVKYWVQIPCWEEWEELSLHGPSLRAGIREGVSLKKWS